MRRVFLWLISLSILATSCSKPEQAYVLPPKGEASLETLDMGVNYDFQYYYNLKSQQVVHTSRVDSWDLAFESNFNGDKVLINGGNNMALLRTNTKNFWEVDKSFCEGKQWILDDPSGCNDCSAFGNWNVSNDSRGTVYILRLDAMGENLRKIKIKSATNFGYVIEVASINAALGTEIFVEKQSNSNYTYFSLSLLDIVKNVEPLPEVWDIVFTRYGYTFYDQTPALPYAVTGVLLNPMGTSAFKDSVRDFYQINEQVITEEPFSADSDVIGFDWKEYDIDKGVYNVKQHYNYIVETKEKDYFKIRFVDFYSSNGLKGSPSFEIAQIK